MLYITCLKYGEPLLEVLSLEDNLLPDWNSLESTPAKAISLLGLSKLLMSSISAKIIEARLTPPPETDKR